MAHKRSGVFLILFGVCLLIAGGIQVVRNLQEDQIAEEFIYEIQAEVEAFIPETVVPAKQFTPERLAQIDASEPEVSVPYYVVNPEIEMPEQVIDGIAYIGVLEIPVLDLELPIASQWSEQTAKVSPCRYSGSVYQKNMVLCAHNFSSHFGRLSTMSQGDTVIFTDLEGNQFVYEVAEFETMDGTAIAQMQAGQWDLTLFTCTVGGRSRVTVRCVEVN